MYSIAQTSKTARLAEANSAEENKTRKNIDKAEENKTRKKSFYQQSACINYLVIML